jgi:hypothetical protein
MINLLYISIAFFAGFAYGLLKSRDIEEQHRKNIEAIDEQYRKSIAEIEAKYPSRRRA